MKNNKNGNIQLCSQYSLWNAVRVALSKGRDVLLKVTLCVSTASMAKFKSRSISDTVTAIRKMVHALMPT